MKFRLTRLACAIILAYASLTLVAAADSQNTRAIVDFAEGNGPVAPLDPDFPDSDLTGQDSGTLTGDDGSLSLNVVPAFVFAQADGTAFPAQLVGARTYPLYSPTRPYAQVSDLRGTGSGWKLTVSAEPFQSEGAPVLRGAKIRLYGGTARSSNPALAPPAVSDPIVIECTDQAAPPVTVAEAVGPGGMGAWIVRWYPLDDQGRFAATAAIREGGVELDVPAGALGLPGSYSATLYWTLSDTV